MLRALLRFLLFSSVLLLASSARADSSAALKAQGDAAFNARRYSEAIAAYDKAYEAGHDAAVLYNKARAHEALEQFPEALSAIERFDKEAPATVRGKVAGLSTLIADIRNHVATLAITCNVQGARVTVRDQPVGETSASALRIQVSRGKARVVVSKEGYASFVQELNLPGESSTTVTAILEAKEPSALVKITSRPPRASVTIDGRPVGATPVELDLTPKTHLIELEREGYEKLATSVVIEAEKPRTFDLQLVESSTVLSKWWFWTAVGGALAVTGGVIAFFALQDNDPPPGTIAPGTVSAPLLRWGK